MSSALILWQWMVGLVVWVWHTILLTRTNGRRNKSILDLL